MDLVACEAKRDGEKQNFLTLLPYRLTTRNSDLLLSEWEVQNKSPAGETEMCSIVDPKRGRNSLFFSDPSRHSTSTHSRPPLSRLVPFQPKKPNGQSLKGKTKQHNNKNKHNQHLSDLFGNLQKCCPIILAGFIDYLSVLFYF